LLENAYEACLAYELVKSNIKIRKQVECPVNYQGIKIDAGYRIDLLVEEELVIELKAVEKLLPLHTAQLLTYLKLSGNKLGLLLNFNTTSLKNGIKRIAHEL
jgi:GxxExxY protein